MKPLNVQKLSIGYDQKKFIEDISLAVQDGEIVTLIGPNGCGKTTLLKTVAGILEPLGGQVFLTGEDLNSLTENDRARRMSVMLTERGNVAYATCFDVVSMGRYPYTNLMGNLSQEDMKLIEEIMELSGISELADKEFSKLSDGQKQRVLLARALVQEPEILLLDEPTSFLDVGYKMEFMSVLKTMAKEKGIGILMSLHELDLAACVSDRVVTITENHQLDLMGKPQDILTKEYIARLFNIREGSYDLKGGFSLYKRADSGSEKVCDNNKKNNVSSGTKFLMVQGTMSSAGKSLVVAGLCRIFKQEGFKVAPFKSQNMALNSFITEDGLEMGRAQVMQAEAAGVKPDVHMNPILLKPTSDKGSQVIVNGKARGNMMAREYFEYKTSLIPDIEDAIDYLKQSYDIVVIEGAGSPAEINLKENDIVNMGMAKLVDAPVLLVGDIDRGGVFAQLLGTLELLEEDERNRVKGLIVNKFRGDKTILDPGVKMLEERSGTSVVGVLPYMDVNLEDEDSLTERFNKVSRGQVDICVIKLPHISNFTDFDVFEQFEQVSVRYIKRPYELKEADLIILPGSKNTIEDMKWLKESGFDVQISKMANDGAPIFGICGGFQMLGEVIEDPEGVEAGGSVSGLSMLPVKTVLQQEKEIKQVQGRIGELRGIFSELSNKEYEGYEIHQGKTAGCNEIICQSDQVYGTYVHGIFDNKNIAKTVVKALAAKKGIDISDDQVLDYKDYKEQEYDRLAQIMREHMDMKKIFEMMGIQND